MSSLAGFYTAHSHAAIQCPDIDLFRIAEHTRLKLSLYLRIQYVAEIKVQRRLKALWV